MLQDKKPKNLLIIGDFNLPQVRLRVFPPVPQGSWYEFWFPHLPSRKYAISICWITNKVQRWTNTLANWPSNHRWPRSNSKYQSFTTNWCKWSCMSLNNPPTVTTLFWPYLQKIYIDYKKIHKELRRMQNGNWEALFEHKSSNDSWNLFKEIMLKHEETCTTVSYIKRPRTLPYLTRSIKWEMNRKNRYWAKYWQTNSQEQYDKFKKARNRLRKITRYSTKKHEDIIATETKANPKKFWNYVSSAKPRQHPFPT